MKRWPRPSFPLVLVPLLCAGLALADPPAPTDPAKAAALPSDYRTVETAVTAKTTRDASPTASAQPAHLGISLDADGQGGLVVADLAADSPAAKAGVQRGDRLLTVDGKVVKDDNALHDLIRGRSPGDAIKLGLSRQDKRLDVAVKLTSPSHPMPPGRQRAVLGIGVAVKGTEGVAIERVTPGSAADKAHLKAGEVILKIDDVAINGPEKLGEVLDSKQPEETVTLTLLLAEKAVEMKMKLGSETVTDGRPSGFDTRGGRGGGPGGGYWSKPGYRLAFIGVEYPDVKHNPTITPKAWQEAMFSRGTYAKTNATGQAVHGSLYDYYYEQSYKTLQVEGKVFDYVEVSKKREEYATGNRMALLTEALDKLLAREGKDALKDFDGVFFVYAGARFPAARGSLYWPHRASVNYGDRRWPYFICEEGGERMNNISVFCHEFGHMLGLPDLYARPENPGMEGVGVWCAMSNQVGNGRPQHFCAWSKEKVGWLKPAVIDPAVKQKLVLAPVEDSPKECFKVLVRPDGSEYLLLENRKKKGFDSSLPADGLLIWRVVANRPFLQESHGVTGPSGPRVFINSVPYPSAANDSYTPFTTPSSRPQLAGGSSVYITNIRNLPDGRVTFQIGYEYE
jgi:M6 family metalloprotease-like protein